MTEEEHALLMMRELRPLDFPRIDGDRDTVGRTHGALSMTAAMPGSVQVCCYQEERQGFNPWSWFVLAPGERLGDRVRSYEQMNRDAADGSCYVSEPGDPVFHPTHELRYLYAAFHLMAQRLTVTVKHDVDRATRRRAERAGRIPPQFIQVITLRRLEQDRPRTGTAGEVDWQWQWAVKGHWRKQPYPSEGIVKDIYIESYVKGPEDKPMKPGTLKLFQARR